ncbi:fructosamine kinase family protein [Actinocorallia populi]|uniref:fructosamine kinase family protein n=1 Tax=Actinocorallia populi TaxID=2079200 RepID=UPI000D087CB3|nr:fructosamine kinase family protein [Actinocorallia populi]
MRLLGLRVVRLRDLGRSHSWTLHHASLEDGREVFVKKGGDFTAEASGLRWLGGPSAEVLEVGEDFLVLPWLPAEPATVPMVEKTARAVAGMHRRGAPRFGADWPGNIADLPLDNSPVDGGWREWYAERRVLPYARMARDQGVLTSSDVREVEAALNRAEQPEEPPSRVHGDLWGGNVLYSRGRGWLIDPAAHGGHRETDLAMLALFGTSHLDAFLKAYDEAAPLAEGWHERVPLHQLHPLLVHCVLYGGSYRESALAAARSV